MPGVFASLQGTGLTGFNLVGLADTDFGIVRLAATATISGIAITNTNTGPTGVIALPITGTDASEFDALGLGGTCAGANLAPGASCLLSLRFHPSTFGVKLATLTFTTSNGLAVPIGLTGSGANAPQVSISPNPLQHDGSRAIGRQDAAPTIYTIANHVSSAPSGHLTVFLSAASPGELASFVLTTTGVANPCHLGANPDPLGTILGDAGTCQVGVLFNPTNAASAVPKLATIEVDDADGSDLNSGNFAVRRGSLDGTATQLLTTPGCGDSGACTTPVALGTGASPVSIVFTNNASVPTNPVQVDQTLLGTQVSIITDGCVTTVIPAGGTCTITVQYQPDGSGLATGASLDVLATAVLTQPSYAVNQTTLSSDGHAHVTFSP